MQNSAHVKLTAILTTAAFLIAAGTVANGWQMYFMAAVLLALPGASFVVGWLSIRGLHARRELPSPAWTGDVVPFCLIVNGAGRWPRLFLQVEDVLPRWLRRADGEPVAFDLPAGGEVRVEYGVETLKRGVHSLSNVAIVAADPLGLFRFRKHLSAPGELVAYPVPEEVPGYHLSGAERYGFRDIPVAAARGTGVDMDGVRQYIPGDPLRRMHWKTVARTGELHVIEFEEARSLSVVLALDTCRLGDHGKAPDSSFEYLVRTAASLAQMAIREGATVRLVSGDSPDLDGTAGRGTEHLLGVYAALARAEAVSDTPLSAGLVARVGILPAGTTLMVLTGTPDAALADALAAYSAAGLRVVVIYADGSSWGRTGASDHDRREQLVVGLYRVGAEVLMLRKTDGMRIMLEPIRSLSDVR
jgi:uncharacterized protein (DUF58 family)